MSTTHGASGEGGGGRWGRVKHASPEGNRGQHEGPGGRRRAGRMRLPPAPQGEGRAQGEPAARAPPHLDGIARVHRGARLAGLHAAARAGGERANIGLSSRAKEASTRSQHRQQGKRGGGRVSPRPCAHQARVNTQSVRLEGRKGATRLAGPQFLAQALAQQCRCFRRTPGLVSPESPPRWGGLVRHRCAEAVEATRARQRTVTESFIVRAGRTVRRQMGEAGLRRARSRGQGTAAFAPPVAPYA